MIKEGLEGVVTAQSTISLVDGEKGHLVYRGHWAKELALNHSFEEVVYLLWHGRLPSEEENEAFMGKLASYRKLSNNEKTILSALPHNMDMMSVIRTLLSSKGTLGVRWPSTIEEGLRMTAAIPTIITERYRLLNGSDPISPDPELDHVSNYLYMLTGEKPTPAHHKALSGYLILTMEHGMNASTFAARVISSTQSDLVSAITGAIGAMKGPLHGGAPSGVIDLLESIPDEHEAEPYLRQLISNGERLMGFGHRVYKTEDPRANALRSITSELSGDDPWFRLANHVEAIAIRLLEEFKPGRNLFTNVEFYAAAILKALSLPTELFTPTFTMSRVIGWTAHVFEQNEHNRIIRPSSLYIGPMPDERT